VPSVEGYILKTFQAGTGEAGAKMFEEISRLIAEGKTEEATKLFNEHIEGVKTEAEKIDETKFNAFVTDINNGTLVGNAFKVFANDTKNKSIINPIFDKRVSDAKDTMEKNFMEKEFPKRLEAAIKERYPDEDPKDQTIAQMQADIDKMKSDGARKDQLNLAIKLSTGMFEDFEPIRYLGSNDEETTENIEKVKSGFQKSIDAAIAANDEEWKKKIGEGSLPGGGGGNTPTGEFDFNKKWSAWSMTERNALHKEDPKKYAEMQKKK
jgi:hypothetical protein